MAAKKSKAATKRKAPAGIAKPAGTDDLARAFQQEYRPVEPTSSNVVVLDADVAPHFRTSRAVNEALRALLRIVRQVRSPDGA
jgi:hypothetical protein